VQRNPGLKPPSNTSTLRAEDREEATLASHEPRLYVLTSPDQNVAGRDFRLHKDEAFLLGRGVDRDGINIADPKMSRLHARIVWDGRSAMSRLGDAGSANGCFVDGERRESATLRHGTVVRLGDTVLVVADSDQMGSVRGRAERAAKSDVSILLIGPTGTGKELVARQIHADSGRRGDFIAVNCASLSENLVGSELFGHTRGAFSGAGVERPGLFRAAHRGTLLLDEVGDLPLALQPALLRALQERAVRPIGAEREVPVDVRIVAATHQDLHHAMDQNRFRRDLFARLAQVELHLPALSERTHELGALISAIGTRLGLAVNVSANAMEALALWRWPHNVRDLENLLLKLRVFSGGSHELNRAFLEREAPELLRRSPRASEPVPKAAPAVGPTPARTKRPSREELVQALGRQGNNVMLVALEFGTSRTQVYRWLKHYGIAPPQAKH
jgi:transcriptional regulator with GAF, ATPase, and Fis domain